MSARDPQRRKVYAWEEQVVAPRDPTRIAFADAQGMVDAIWTELGLRFPPKVEPLPRQATATVADASRLTIRLRRFTPSWCLLHEIAHAMASTHDGVSDGHGPVFMGLYARLLVRYLRLPEDELLCSLATTGIATDPIAAPLFVAPSTMPARPSTPAAHVSCSRNSQIVLASGTLSCSANPAKRMNENRSRSRYSVWSSESV
jgi:hypothetical protein